ncbi:MAG: hypothetical protein FWE31_02055 [Firmicutes bacterium]|nr:hypothetical protein [Bacillota bacterium]
MEKRNRSQGWRHAKLSGHENEKLLKQMLESGSGNLLKALDTSREEIASIDIGGLNEKNIPSIFGDTTKSKTDCVIVIGDNKKNVSLKKGNGQVYLITPDRFIRGFQQQYKKIIPDIVKRGISLYWGTAGDTLAIIEKVGTKKSYETRKHRLSGDTLRIFDGDIYKELVNWFTENAAEIFDFCFSRGLAANPSDYAEYIWYFNTLGENDNNSLYCINTLKGKIAKAPPASYSPKGGGTTIWLPFGFVQWHSPTKTIPGCMQFHHQYKKIKTLAEEADDE